MGKEKKGKNRGEYDGEPYKGRCINHKIIWCNVVNKKCLKIEHSVKVHLNSNGLICFIVY